MKNKMLKASAFLLLAVVSCKKNGQSNNANFTGTWKNVHVSFNNYGEILNYDAKEFPCLTDFELAIKPDSTFTEQFNGTDTCFVDNLAGVNPLFPFTWLYSPTDKPVNGTIDRNAGGYRFLFNVRYFMQASLKTSGPTDQLILADQIDGNSSVVWTYTFERKQ